jgi:hypothetical protein
MPSNIGWQQDLSIAQQKINDLGKAPRRREHLYGTCEGWHGRADT